MAIVMAALNTRAGCRDDTEWLYQLFKETNSGFIETSWGWDELLQRESFFSSLPGSGFTILEKDGEPVGGFNLVKKKDHLWLELLIIKPQWQGKGFGTVLLDEAKSTAKKIGLPIKLSVLKNNPAADFYLEREFTVDSDDSKSIKMTWRFAD